MGGTTGSFAMLIDSHHVKISVQSHKDGTERSQRENVSPKESLYVDKHLNTVHTNQ